MSRSDRGFRRGMPWSMFLGCLLGFAWGRARLLAGRPKNVEEYFYRTRGRLLTRVAAQGFQEKLTGVSWVDMPVPVTFPELDEASLVSTLKAGMVRAISTKEVNTFKGSWRHPAKGTGQICDALACGITQAGGSFALGAKLLEVRTAGHRIESVVAEVDSARVEYVPEHVVSSVPLDVMLGLLGKQTPKEYAAAAGAPSRRRTVVLVYLFLNRPPRFPHAWLQVTCKKTRIGRITNYGGFNAEMVPPGLGCLCCEYYCYGADPLLDMDQKELVRTTREYCVSSGLIDSDAPVDDLVLKLPGADASQNRHNWMTSMRLGLLDEIKPFSRLYHVGRTDLDIATLAGIEAAEAIISGDRSIFDRHFDPTEIGIRSEKKVFEFRVPASALTGS
jgi:protoporphyrinogen oxidase